MAAYRVSTLKPDGPDLPTKLPLNQCMNERPRTAIALVKGTVQVRQTKLPSGQSMSLSPIYEQILLESRVSLTIE
jgi:hypothetical protein